MKRQLLCTFAVSDSLSLTKDYISTYFKINNNRIFLYSDIEYRDNYILVYNIEKNLREGLAKNTILVHRKKESNTIYTINALNMLIMQINNGILDKSFKIDWENYTDKLLLVKGDDLNISTLKYEKTLYI